MVFVLIKSTGEPCSSSFIKSAKLTFNAAVRQSESGPAQSVFRRIVMREFRIGTTSLKLVQGDITQQDTDAIVNAANSSLLGGGDVDGAIHRKGGPEILEECRAIRNRQGSCAPGDAVITGGGKLQAKWVVRAVGPVWQGGNSNEATTLAAAYANSLELALEVGARTVAFPSISTGAYGYPVEKAALIGLNELRNFVEAHPGKFSELRFVLFDANSFDAYQQAAQVVLGS
jgi:O-acetyl-ADP-ribose deacetylase